MKTLRLVIAAAAAAVFISGCATDQAFIKAQADAAVAAGNARVAEAQAAAEQARAVIAVAAKLDAGGAAAYVMGQAFRSAAAPAQVAVAAVQRPRDFLDYLAGFTSVVGALGNIAVPIVSVRENARTARAGFERDLGVENARQAGESTRITSVAQIARDVAASTPQPNVTTVLSGTGVIGSGSYVGPVTTTRTCNGGSAASGGNGGQGTTTGGAGATGGSAPGGVC